MRHEQEHALGQYESVWNCFSHRDMLAFRDESALGKPVGADLREGNDVDGDTAAQDADGMSQHDHGVVRSRA